MDLINQTAAPAQLMVSSLDGGPDRFGILVAKATFSLLPGSQPELVTQDPFPIFAQDEKTDAGILPGDAMPRRDRVFEVILLGAAYPETGKEAASRMVELSVGTVTRRLAVFGDRRWVPSPEEPGISAPLPFQRMPLTYARAFGGSCPVRFDADTVLDMEDRMNKHGLGFDAAKLARDTAAGLKSPPGFPTLEYQRPLPNLEDPAHPIRAWSDAPDPCCWATMPDDIGFRMARLIRKFGETRQPPTREEAVDQAYHRAHPDWIIALPPPGARVALTGLAPGPPVSFPLPDLGIAADYVLGDRTGTRELAPHMLVLLPDARRFYIVYRSAFTMSVQPDTERSFRLRLTSGWFRHPEGEARPIPAAGGGA